MGKKTTKRISVLAALLLAFTMLITAFVLSTGNGKTRAFANSEQNQLLYIVDCGRVDNTSGGKLTYGYDPATSSPKYVDSTVTFVKRNGGTFGDITEYNGTPLTRLWNSYTDKPFDMADSSGKNWGFIDNYSDDMPHRLGRAGEHAAGYSEFRSVNDSEVTTELLTYKFEVPEGIPLDVTVITHSPSGWGRIDGTISVNGGEAMPLVAGDYDESHSIADCTGVLDNTDNKYYLTLTFGENGAQTVVNGFIIREKPFDVTYHLNGGNNNVANKATYAFGAGFTLADPTRTGYTFDGWYDAEEGGNKVTAISDTQTGNVTLYARWNIVTYTVTYNLDGGTNDAANRATYTYGNGFTLAEPTRTGYVFDGWYDAENGGNKVTAISNTQTGDITLYAHWTQETAKSGGCNSSIGGTAALFGGLLLLSAGAIAILKCKKKN